MSDAAPTSTGDSRPRPQYGEYATPEEQRARIAGPLQPPREGQPVASEPAREAAPAPSADAGSDESATERAPRRRFVDRLLTYILLGYGLATVITAIPTLTAYSDYAAAMFEILGVDAELTDPAAGRPWGLAAALVLGLGWVATAALSWMSLRRRRVTWWIPVVGGILVNLVSSILMLVPLLADPGFQAGVLQFSGG